MSKKKDSSSKKSETNLITGAALLGGMFYLENEEDVHEEIEEFDTSHDQHDLHFLDHVDHEGTIMSIEEPEDHNGIDHNGEEGTIEIDPLGIPEEIELMGDVEIVTNIDDPLIHDPHPEEIELMGYVDTSINIDDLVLRENHNGEEGTIETDLFDIPEEIELMGDVDTSVDSKYDLDDLVNEEHVHEDLSLSELDIHSLLDEDNLDDTE